MPELSFEFEVYCAKCGAGLCPNCTEGKTRGRNAPFISVEPCEKCLEEAKDAGCDKGYGDGEDEGYEKGFDEGHREGEG